MDLISAHWDQILLLGAIVFHAARSYALLSEAQKDIKQLQDELLRYTKWTQHQAEDIVKLGNNADIVKLRAEMDVVNKQITSMWEFMNSLRDRFNGHGKH
jgi:hypothetical protein|tara:strand:- start:145 stop:444 length:300 start_codon:yes stop_codon:yes gene_type:complete